MDSARSRLRTRPGREPLAATAVCGCGVLIHLRWFLTTGAPGSAQRHYRMVRCDDGSDPAAHEADGHTYGDTPID